MLEMRPDCEKCGKDLAADAAGAVICSFECTYCDPCAEDLAHTCPNCGGGLVDRPVRATALLTQFPASTERKHKA